MLKKTLIAVIAASTLSLALPAQAEWSGAHRDKAEQGCQHDKSHGPRVGMRELKLSDKQKRQMREIHRQQRTEFRQKMNAILTPDQRVIAAKHEASRKAIREARRDKK